MDKYLLFNPNATSTVTLDTCQKQQGWPATFKLLDTSLTILAYAMRDWVQFHGALSICACLRVCQWEPGACSMTRATMVPPPPACRVSKPGKGANCQIIDRFTMRANKEYLLQISPRRIMVRRGRCGPGVILAEARSDAVLTSDPRSHADPNHD